ncbi:unnamed protein product, partial [Meganyctiphanes norvegica]
MSRKLQKKCHVNYLSDKNTYNILKKNEIISDDLDRVCETPSLVNIGQNDEKDNLVIKHILKTQKREAMNSKKANGGGYQLEIIHFKSGNNILNYMGVDENVDSNIYSGFVGYICNQCISQKLKNVIRKQNYSHEAEDLDGSLDDSFTFMTYTDTNTKEEYKRLMAKEKENFATFIGKASDMVNTIPDEKVTAMFLGYLCTRLLDLSAEIKAARIIQMAWRRRLAIKREQELKRRTFKAFKSFCFAYKFSIHIKNFVMKKFQVDSSFKKPIKQSLLNFDFYLRSIEVRGFGFVLYLFSNSQIVLYVTGKLLNNPHIASDFAHPSVPHHYKEGFEDSLKTFQLKKFLLLVLFLDHAKKSRLIDHDPCLFNKEAEIKESREILLAFSREFLGGVGDITKHLGYLGYNVTHKQSVLDEFDYAVTNLCVDLRCGIRLTRVVEVLTSQCNLSGALRAPAISRLQKVHNTDVALKALEANGNPGLRVKFPSKDIVEGHREQTLELLWTIIFKYQITSAVSACRLREEIKFLQRSLKVRAQLSDPASSCLSQVNEQLKESSSCLGEDSVTTPEVIMNLLKVWSALTCAHYGLMVHNLTVSFSDGRALCLLLHYYHSELLPLEAINWKTTQTLQSTQEAEDLDGSLDDSFTFMTYTDTNTKEEYKRLMAKEKENFATFIGKVIDLGGVPILIKASDMVNTIPDEKVTAMFLGYLCTRLLDLSAEIKAARIIQMAWRRRLAIKKREQELKVKYS